MKTELPESPKRDEDAFVVPHDLDAERAVLGAALVNPASADYVADHLTAEDFFRRAHQPVFLAIRELREVARAVDLLMLRTQLGPTRLEAVGGPAYLSALMDGVPRSTNVEHYSQILKDLRAKRALVSFANRTLDHIAQGDHSSKALIADADRRLIEIQTGHLDGRMMSLRESAPALRVDLEWRHEHRGELTGVDTGFESINRETLGWQAGDLIVIAARPSIGKTTFVMNAAAHAASKGKRVAVFSLEMRRKQLEYRLMSSLSKIPLSRILSGFFMEPDWKNLSEASQQMDDMAIHIDDRSGQTAWQIRSACRQLKAEGGLDLVVIDYVQLMASNLERRNATRNDEVTDTSRRLKTLADEVSCPVLLLSQMSRAASKRDDPKPKLSDLRESGALEQDADLVCFLHRKNHREGGLTTFIIEKARNGPTGSMNLTLEKDIVTFVDGGEEPQPQAKPAGEEEPKRRRRM